MVKTFSLALILALTVALTAGIAGSSARTGNECPPGTSNSDYCEQPPGPCPDGESSSNRGASTPAQRERCSCKERAVSRGRAGAARAKPCDKAPQRSRAVRSRV
jgi:hypothetical protein